MMADSRAVCPSVDVSVGSTVTSLQTDDKMKQEARSFLRERFIRAVLAMNGKIADFNMYENTNVSAVFGSCDREFVNIYVRDLKTPSGSISDALLRTNDIENICIDDINPSE